MYVRQVPSQRIYFWAPDEFHISSLVRGDQFTQAHKRLSKEISPYSGLIHPRKFFLPRPLSLRRRTALARFRFILHGPPACPRSLADGVHGHVTKVACKALLEKRGMLLTILSTSAADHLQYQGFFISRTPETQEIQSVKLADSPRTSKHRIFNFPPIGATHGLGTTDMKLQDDPTLQTRFPDLQKSHFRFHHRAEGSTPVPGVPNNPIQQTRFFGSVLADGGDWRFECAGALRFIGQLHLGNRSSTHSVFRKSKNQDFDAQPLRVPDGAYTTTGEI
ncbi:hypothetical protein DFP72DRAFT_1042557 [Ephemerocybe angulata]|uniref:Uncharacterized protein n=1 Tax=Ephemerocybe angulata TaxID=980116 RepID=A0A8H6I9V3_9AGAR|nr:hypothetical protein DFP72DRAFT_1042557 [Tulosesus angulatus]